jgi:Pseudouridylate synthases, 23S RNA-specific
LTTISDNKNYVSERILYEDNHLIVVNKLPSEIVQGDKTGDTPLSEIVKAYLKDKYQKPGTFLQVLFTVSTVLQVVL